MMQKDVIIPKNDPYYLEMMDQQEKMKAKKRKKS